MLILTVQLHKSASWVKLTHYCTFPSCRLPARGVGNQKRTEWTARPAAAAATAAAAGGGCGGDGDSVDSPADFPYNLCDRKLGDQSQKSGLGKMRLVHVDKNCDMWNFPLEEHLKLDNCSWPKFQPAKEEKRGVVVAQ